MTLANLLKTAYVNNTDWDGMAEVAVNHMYGEIYAQAAGLFDPDTTLDLSNEYHRGVVEVVMRFTGTDSDDKEDIAKNISERTSTAHMLAVDDNASQARTTLWVMYTREVTAHDNRSYRIAKERGEYKREPAPDTLAILTKLEREQEAANLRIAALKTAVDALS